MRVKYNRVSTIQQTGDRFTSDTEHYDLVLLDKVSGSVSFDEREQGKKLFNLIKEGKVSEVVVEVSIPGKVCRVFRAKVYHLFRGKVCHLFQARFVVRT